MYKRYFFTTRDPKYLLGKLAHKNVALVDLENICNISHITPRLRGECNVIYVSVPMKIPNCSLPQTPIEKEIYLGHFIHPNKVREGSDHIITALGTFLQMSGNYRVHVVSNDKMVHAANRALPLFKKSGELRSPHPLAIPKNFTFRED